MSQYKLVRFNLNGKDVEKMVDVRASLTDMLRNDYHMTSVKKGCEVGECGACNVIIDGEAFNSCIYLAVWADGKHIRTLESLMGPDGELSNIQQAFIEETAVQCGFCTPGFDAPSRRQTGSRPKARDQMMIGKRVIIWRKRFACIQLMRMLSPKGRK